MGFLKKSKVPGELPDLAIKKDNGMAQHSQHSQNLPPLADPNQAVPPSLPTQIDSPKPLIPQQSQIPEPPKVQSPIEMKKTEIAGEDYLEFSNVSETHKEKEDIRKQISETIDSGVDENSFFDKILDDINGEIEDLGKLEEWYENKFLPQDVVSNMRNYWEDNKADMIIRSFGSEYKEKVNEQIKKLQNLEGDWREIYFKLVKKEEEMKKEERLLKETLSEFVELCKRRKSDGEKEGE